MPLTHSRAKTEIADPEEEESMRPRSAVTANGAEIDVDGSSREERGSFLQTVRNWVTEKFRLRDRESLKEAVEEILEESEEVEDSFGDEEKFLFRNLLQFGELAVHDIMIQRADVHAVSEKVSLAELKTFIEEYEHTRMPVYRRDYDDVIGFIHIKDLVRFFGNEAEFSVTSVLRDIPAVPPSMKVLDLLIYMRSRGIHIALVVDEYGGMDGIVTLEDIFEVLVGDIQDEHDDDTEPEVIRLSEQTAIADARIDIHKLEEYFGVTLLDDEEEKPNFDTLGGLLFTILGHVPRKGEMLEYQGLRFIIDEADPRRIRRVKIYLLDPQSTHTTS